MESDEKSDPVEPLFKYLRLACDLKEIVKNSSISCIFCTEKVVIVGTSWGDLHILDHEGNVNSHQKFPKHIVGINQISVDLKGEYIASCSDDGQVSPIGMFVVGELIFVFITRYTSTVYMPKITFISISRSKSSA
jgi:vacuolar protein sorting-associated protein 41